eukprot:CAMPEP_0197031406 /NCGR_PEP_ID=MMETSP1384-20130603/10419_1 /TAXON_ID=29189 /ORGANISM="Ammonia sp." /LENGTH=216 /DNA_ID=CAMNT_0042460925 /DNA_START=57 /DNA_END=704 /DNA_ORIENTATION=-
MNINHVELLSADEAEAYHIENESNVDIQNAGRNNDEEEPSDQQQQQQHEMQTDAYFHQFYDNLCAEMFNWNPIDFVIDHQQNYVTNFQNTLRNTTIAHCCTCCTYWFALHVVLILGMATGLALLVLAATVFGLSTAENPDAVPVYILVLVLLDAVLALALCAVTLHAVYHCKPNWILLYVVVEVITLPLIFLEFLSNALTLPYVAGIVGALAFRLW